MHNNLKPCPFCGSDDVSAEKHRLCQDAFTASVTCHKCGGSMIGSSDVSEIDAELDAIKKWNARHVETCQNIGDDLNPLHEVDQFVCSKCGFHLEDWVEVYYDYDYGFPPDKAYYEYALEHCPHCSRKVVD